MARSLGGENYSNFDMHDFSLDPAETKALEEWQKSQKEKDSSNLSTVGGRWTFSFTPTGVGTILVVKDNLLGDEIDLTNTDNW